MGLSPREVDRLTLAELAAMAEGFRRFHGAKDDEAPSVDAFLEALADECEG
ncbi:MAG TPA: hypothetical protein VM434_15735 [Beijerinckiaceae bacterium]|nr:hypothetical protein [Beijerinckiaceae bacterium]